MPFKSQKQETWLKINRPGIWKEWTKKYKIASKVDSLKAKRKINSKSRKKKRV